MPYKLKKKRGEDLYWVVDIDGHKYSKDPIPKERAEAQIRALYASEKNKHGGDIPDGEFEGSGLWDSVKSLYNKAKNEVVNKESKLRSVIIPKTANELFNPQSKLRGEILPAAKSALPAAVAITNLLVLKRYSPSVRKWLEENVETPIHSLQVRRAPIARAINTALQVASQGHWEESKAKYGYDKMFHLALIVNNKSIMEKLERVHFEDKIDDPADAEFMDVFLGKDLKIGEFVLKTEQLMGDNYFTYDAFANNCQNFVGNMLSANGLMNEDLKAFIYQPVDELIKEQPDYLHDFSKTLTNLGAIGNQVMSGGYIKRRCRGYGHFTDKFLRGVDDLLEGEVDNDLKNEIEYIFNLLKDELEKEGKTFSISTGYNPAVKDVKEGLVKDALDMVYKRIEAYKKYESKMKPLLLAHKHLVAREKQDVLMREELPMGKKKEFAPVRPRPTGSGGGKVPTGEFEKQLREIGLDPSLYLKEAQRRAKKVGLPYKLIGFAEDHIHKLAIPDERGRMVRFGRIGYGDHIIWSHLELKKKVSKGFAEQKQRVFRNSHSQMKGAWKKDAFSPNNLSLNVLW